MYIPTKSQEMPNINDFNGIIRQIIEKLGYLFYLL